MGLTTKLSCPQGLEDPNDSGPGLKLVRDPELNNLTEPTVDGVLVYM